MCFAAAEHQCQRLYFNLKGHFWITSYAFIFCLFDLVFLFDDCHSCILFGSGFGLFQCVRLGFDSCIIFLSVYNAVFVLPGTANCFCGKMLYFLSRLFVF